MTARALWSRVVIALAIPVIVFGTYLRFVGLPDAFCRSPDELAEMMPGIRLHALPFFNLGDALRYNFFQSMFYSQHGLGDASFYYLTSGILSLIGLPVSERWLFVASGVTNVALAAIGAIFAARVLRSAPAGWIFGLLVLVSPFFVFVSRTGWGRLTWTPLLLVLLFLCQQRAMRRRGIVWPLAFVALAAFISLTDGFMNLPILAVFGLLIHEGSWLERARKLARDRVFLAGFLAFTLGVALDVAIGLAARRRGTDLTMMGYVLLRGASGDVSPSAAVYRAWAGVLNQYLGFPGAWLLALASCALGIRDGLRGRPIGFVAAWWVLASAGVIRYVTGIESMGRPATVGWLNASSLAVPTLLLVSWLIVSLAEGTVPILRRVHPRARLALAALCLVLLAGRMAEQAHTVAFSPGRGFGIRYDQLAYIDPSKMSACRALKSAAFYVRSRGPALPYVFHLTSNVYLGHIGEFYYGLSYGRSLRPEDPNHVLDFGMSTGQFTRPHPPEAFYRAYGVPQFDYYVDFMDEEDPFKSQVIPRLLSEGARIVATIRDGDRAIGRILSFRDEPYVDVDYRTAAAAWDRQFGRAGTLLLQPLAGTAYHFGYNWRTPE
jgi:hypothetical protein